MSDLEILDIPHSEIEPNPENPNAMDPRTLNALRDDIETRGFVQPVLVRPLERIAGEVKMHVADCPMTKADPKDRYVCTCQHYDNDPKLTPEGGIRYRIIDGEHRWRVLGELGAETVPCIVEDSTEADADIRMITMNRLRGQFVPIKLAHLLADLAERIDRKEIQERLSMEASELKDLLDLGDFLEPPTPDTTPDKEPPEPPPPGRDIAIVATPEQATELLRLLGTDEPEEQAERIRQAAIDVEDA
jgi:ParB-like chromosome segregation protein Spo0J